MDAARAPDLRLVGLPSADIKFVLTYPIQCQQVAQGEVGFTCMPRDWIARRSSK